MKHLVVVVVLTTVHCTFVPAQIEPHADSGPSVDAGAAETLGFQASNITLDGIDTRDLPDWDIATIEPCRFSSDDGTAKWGVYDCVDSPAAQKVKFATVTQSDGTKVGVFVLRSLRVEQTANVVFAGSLPIVLVAMESIEIFGTVTVTSGQFVGADALYHGHGPGGGFAGEGNGLGGGGSYCGKGGVGAAMGNVGGAAGATYGAPSIVPLIGGSVGSGSNGGGDPGQGGGAVELVAGKTFTLGQTGSITASGWPGVFGAAGGSGGSILLEATTVSIQGTLVANGGDSSTAKGSSGAGLDGESTATTAGAGGAGRIRVNAASASITGASSPAVGTACVTQGTLGS